MARSAFPTGQVIRIVITTVLLVAVLVMKQRCGKAAIEMFRAFDAHVDAGGTTNARDGGAKALTPVDAAH